MILWAPGERAGRAGAAGGERGAACAHCASWAPRRCGPRSWRGRVPKDNADRERRGRGWQPSPESEPGKAEGKPTWGAGMGRGPEKVLARSLEDEDCGTWGQGAQWLIPQRSRTPWGGIRHNWSKMLTPLL